MRRPGGERPAVESVAGDGGQLELLGGEQHVGEHRKTDQERCQVGHQHRALAEVRRSTIGWLTFSS